MKSARLGPPDPGPWAPEHALLDFYAFSTLAEDSGNTNTKNKQIEKIHKSNVKKKVNQKPLIDIVASIG